jgi:hypothetical protein
MDGDLIHKIAQFPLRTWFSGRQYVNFSDADRDTAFPVSLLAYLAERLDLPALRSLGALDLESHQEARRDELPWALRNIAWGLDVEQEPFVPDAHNWFSEMQWMISRYDPADRAALVLAVKGGHNSEMHNQNDVGALIVHVNGESVIADPGRGRYTRQYFMPETRYDFFVNQSFGHSTPVPNEQQQGTGQHFAAEVLEHVHTAQRDMLALELADAYPAEADLESLRRVVALHREQPRGRVEIMDGVSFKSAPGTFESVLITFGAVEDIEPGVLVLRGEQGALRVEYDAENIVYTVETREAVDLRGGPEDIRRVRFAFKEPIKSGMLRLNIVPL